MEDAEDFYQGSFAKKYGMSLYLASVMPNLSISLFSSLKQRHAGKIFVFFRPPPLALALLRGNRGEEYVSEETKRSCKELWSCREWISYIQLFHYVSS